MSKYKKFQVRGSDRYMKDGKLISEAKVSPQILKVLSNVPEYDDAVTIEEVSKNCIFCGKPTLLSRFLNLKTLYICEEHYYSKTVGETVHQYEELQNATSQR